MIFRLKGIPQEKLETVAAAMSPQIYAAREGRSIVIAKAPVGDPEFLYRKLVQELLRETGELSPVGQERLKHKGQLWDLSAEQMQTIEQEVLRPFVELQENLNKYELTYRKTLEYEATLSERTQVELKDYQKDLNLQDEAVHAIHFKVQKQLNIPYTSCPLSSKFLVRKETYLTSIWSMVLDIVTPPIAQTLFQHSCQLIAFDGQTAKVFVQPNYISLVSSRFSKIETAFRELQGKLVNVELYQTDTEALINKGGIVFAEDLSTLKYTQEQLNQLWRQVTALIKPPIAQTLFQQQCRLLSFDEKYVLIGIKSKQLMRLAEQRLDNLYTAFEQVLGHSVEVKLKVCQIPKP